MKDQISYNHIPEYKRGYNAAHTWFKEMIRGGHSVVAKRSIEAQLKYTPRNQYETGYRDFLRGPHL